MSEWTPFIERVKKEKRFDFLFQAGRNCHKLFLDMTNNRFAIADDSGRTPDQTEDGVMWVDESQDMTLGALGDSIYVNLLVRKPDGKTMNAITDISTAMYLRDKTDMAILLQHGDETYRLVEVEP